MDTMKIGVIGCGKISSAYFNNLVKFNILEVKACCDLVPERAKAQQEKYNITHVYTMEQMLGDPEIELIVNLTIPAVHKEVAITALSAGKHVYNEKPLTVTRKEGEELVTEAKKRGLRIGCAPDTILGGGTQTARKLIDDGAIGKPVAATAFLMCHGHESWHPDPEFYYKRGGGPLFDMGPYYLSSLITMLGPVLRVSGSTAMSFVERTITSEAKKGQKIIVDVPTHISTTLDFVQGAVCTMAMSFDVWAHQHSCIEIYGSEGTLIAPNPNTFGGPVQLRKPGEKEWTEIPLTHTYIENTRGLGVADMADAIRTNRPHRANDSVAFHVLDIMKLLMNRL